jgi:hypothetical protein
MAVRDGSRDRSRDRVVLRSDLKPPKVFTTFMRVDIQTGVVVRKINGSDNYLFYVK